MKSKKLITGTLLSVFVIAALAFTPNPKAENGNAAYAPIPGTKVPITGDLNQMKYFFAALKDAKTKKMRIAHYGDSIIEGDLISSDIRQFLQQKFGGNGAGFVSMNSFDIQFRKTTKHTFSGDWKSAAVYTKNPDKLPLGINGAAFQAAENGWVKFETTIYSKWLKTYKTARIFYTNATPNATIKYQFGNQPAQTMKLQAGGGKIKEAVINSNSDVNSLQINFSQCGNTIFYGVSLENGNGVYVDNLPLRGNSGASIYDIPAQTLKDFNELNNYKLIILQFGLNVLTSDYSDYAWYVNKMDNVINNLKQAFPNTSIMLISIGDKSEKQGTKFVTSPGVLQLVKAQKNIAEKNKIAFWSMFDAMGGKNSMDSWVNASPPLAFKDYSHLTYEGATRVGDLLFQAMMDEYNKMK